MVKQMELQSKFDRPLVPQKRKTKPSLPNHPSHVFIGFDMETNGISQEARLEVLELAAVSFSTGQVFHSLVNPGMDTMWSKGAQAVHLIPKEAVMNDITRPWDSVWRDLRSWIDQEAGDKTVVLVAHNGVRFDFPILIEKAGSEVNDKWHILDTLLFANKLKSKGLIEGKLNLGALRDWFKVESSGASHRADCDVIDSGWILRKLLKLEGNNIRRRMTQIVKENASYSQPLRDLGTKSKNKSKLPLLRHIPRNYISEVDPSELKNHENGVTIGIRGVILSLEVQNRRGFTIIEWALEAKEKTTILVTQFCGKGPRSYMWAKSSQERFKIGTEVHVLGKLSSFANTRCTIVMDRMSLLTNIEYPSLIPVYPSKKTLKSLRIQEIIHNVIHTLDRPKRESVVLARQPMDGYNLKVWLDALLELHHPRSETHLLKAKQMIKFHDLVCLHLLLLAKKTQNLPMESTDDGAVFVYDNEMVEIGRSAFPHALTEDQASSLEEILEDMKGITPMMRVLQGDVGTGKTIVALLSMLAVYGSQHQSVLMVPTEILAFQHYATLMSLVGNCPEEKRPNVELLTSSSKRSERERIIEGVNSGDVDLIVGTHSLLNKDIQFKHLGLMIIDEQHKFGVYQRQGIKLGNDGFPHMLMMSATPIPRSLALIMRGSTSLSTLRSNIPWKQEITTKIVSPEDIDEMYKEVKKELSRGGRVYVVFPLIEQSQSEKFAHLKAAEAELDNLQKTRFKDYKCGLMHGRMSTQEKTEAFEDFMKGKTQVLISTTVVEVGIDVKEASVMIIHHPERFGLAQLHQLRGRVGRGKKKSTCYLIPSQPVPRIDILVESDDGEAIAHADLMNRGPGDFFGSKQSGKCSFFTFSWEEMIKDPLMVEEAHQWASEFFKAHDGTIPDEIMTMMKVQGFPSLDEFEI
eukprot:g5376.t1